ncbi:MAG: hypothetical protein NTZ18_02990 [Candidatus Komeilibacteria bacterium]|nr:hypothetical protein [Candidatus Komeilibacteria bacterium]
MSDINLLPEELRGAEEKVLARPSGSAERASFYVPPKESIQSAPLVKASAPASPPKPKAVFNAGPKPDRGLTPPKLMTDQEVNLTANKHESLLARFLRKRNKGAILKNVAAKNHNNYFIEQSLDVNLIPEGLDLLPLKKLYRRWLLFALSGVLLVALSYFGLVLYAQKVANDDQSLAAALQSGETKYNQLRQQEKDLTAWLEKMGLIKNLFSDHVYWTNFFKALESVTIPSVYYTDISTSLPGEVTLSATTDSYLSAARQYLAYQEAAGIIKSASISGLASSETGGVSFSVNLSFSPAVYAAAPK